METAHALNYNLHSATLTEKSAISIRQAVDADRTAIVDLLKASLGETTVAKSEALWTWKHEQNPFGRSLVLVAEQGDRIVGVRAFMQWTFHRRGKVYKCLRAVDTATHPEFMGKGIFKKLTLQLVEQCKANGFHFIYNTPNEQSRPGYLKMGWVQQGRLPLKLQFIKPLQVLQSKMTKTVAHKPVVPVQKWTQRVFDVVSRAQINDDKVCTYLNADYVSWRYANNPLVSYNYISDEKEALLIYRIKDGGTGREMRIVDFFITSGVADRSSVSRFLAQQVKEECKKLNVDFISCSATQYNFNRRYLSFLGVLPSINAGPVVTMRNLNMPSDFLRFINRRYWNFSLGDLELF